MEEKIEVGKRVPRKNGPKSRTKVVYPYELRLKAVKLNLEEGISREALFVRLNPFRVGGLLTLPRVGAAGPTLG